MATQPHHDDDQAKKPTDETKPPKPPVPNMELDEAEEIPLVEEVVEAEEVIDAEVVEAVSASDVVLADEEVTPKSADSPPLLSQPRTGVRLGAQATPVPTAKASPASDVAPVEEIVDALPASDVVPVEEVVEAMPASDVVHAEEVVEVMPASDVVHAEVVVEAMPASDVVHAEEVVEVMPASDVVTAEEIIEAHAPTSDELLAEVMAEPSSATRKAEAVLADEPIEVEEAVLAEEAKSTGSSAVLFDELTEPVSAEKKTADYEAASSGKKKTIPFEHPSSGAAKGEEELLVTEEELMGSAEASAVNLGDMPARKGSSVTGIDKVAEALESGVDLEGATTGKDDSVEFDDLLEDLGDSAEAEIARPKSRKRVEQDAEGSTEMDAELLGDLDAAEKPSKKAKKHKPASDEVDLESLFDDEKAGASASAESAHPIDEGADGDATVAYDATDAADALDLDDEFKKTKKDSSAEEAELFDDEVEPVAAVAEDEVDLGGSTEEESPLKEKGKGKKKAAVAEDEEEAAALLDDEEDSGAVKKKSKKKTAAVVAPAEKPPGRLLPLLGGMGIASFLLVGLFAAGLFIAPETIEGIAKSVRGGAEQPGVPARKTVEKTKVELARALMDKEKYKDAVTLLAAATDPGEVATRGEAEWFGYVQQQNAKKAALDKDAEEVKKARADLKGKDLFIAQMDATLGGGARAQELADQLTKANAAVAAAKKDIDSAKAEKEAAEKNADKIADVLAKSKLIEDKNKLDVAALDATLKSLAEDKAALESVNKLLKDAEVKDAGDKGVKSILDGKKDADDKLAAVNKILDDEKIKDQGPKGVQAIAEARNKTAKDRDDLLAAMTAAMKELIDGRIVPADADPRKDLVEAAKKARARGDSPLTVPLTQLGLQLGGVGAGAGKFIGNSFSGVKALTELGYYKAREPFIQSPQQKLDNSIALLRDRAADNPKELAAMTREADWVLSPEAKSDAAAQAKAHFVRGLAARNQHKYDDARKEFDAALKNAGPWSDAVKQAKLELTDPNVYYLPRIQHWTALGNYKAALTEVGAALKAMPTEPRLFAERGLIGVELIRGQGAKTSVDAQKMIRADADAAGKNPQLAAEAAYIVGRLDEELGNWSEAEKQYRQAIKGAQGDMDAASKFRIALARLLLRDRPETLAPVAPPAADKKDDKTGAAESPPDRTLISFPLPLTLEQAKADDDTEDPAVAARLKETIELANDLIASKNDKIKGQGYLILGSTLTKQGKRTEGLREYTKGLKLLHPGLQSDELGKMIDEHPAFQQPDSTGNDPILSERHFGEGLHLYWNGQYAQAEAQFATALKHYDKDARFYYFLGLARINQKTRSKRDAAIHAWELGARLEAQAVNDPYAVRDINFALERVQGPQRQMLDGYRYKAAEPADAK